MAPSSPDRIADRQVQDGSLDELAYLALEQVRWAGHPTSCPQCRTEGRCYLLRPSGGVRRTRTGAQTGRRLWKCGACRRQFSVLTGTVLQGTRIPLAAWLSAFELLVGADAAVTATEVSEATGMSREAANHVLARWQAAVDVEPALRPKAASRHLFQG